MHAPAIRALALAFALAGCTQVPVQPLEWSGGWRDGGCAAIAHSPQQAIFFDATRDPAAGAIRIYSAQMLQLNDGEFYDSVTIRADQEAEIPVTATGIRKDPSTGWRLGTRALSLLRSHPRGFTLTVQRKGYLLYEAAIPPTAPAVEALDLCLAEHR